MGAAHAFELFFVFGTFDHVDKSLISADVPARNALSRSMMSYWAEFAYSGDPGRGRDGAEVAWTVWESGRSANRVLLLDTTNDGGIRISPILVTRDTISDTLDADPRFTNQERCALAERLFDRACSSG